MDPSAESMVRRSPPPLRGLVHAYSGYRFVGFEAGHHVGLPGAHVTLIVSLHQPVVLASGPDRSRPPEAHMSMVGGLHLGPVVIAHDGTQSGIHVDIEPFALPVLFGCAASDLTDETVGLDALLGASPARELEERLLAAPTWSARFAVVDEVLLRGVPDRSPALAPGVAEAWRRLVATHGRVSVAALADEVGWSRRHLSERFGRELGLPPKAFGRILRLQRATGLLKADPRRSLADVAAIAGYADQPHLNRDFRELTGTSPTVWMAAERLPFVQDDDREFEASSAE